MIPAQSLHPGRRWLVIGDGLCSQFRTPLVREKHQVGANLEFEEPALGLQAQPRKLGEDGHENRQIHAVHEEEIDLGLLKLALGCSCQPRRHG